MTRLRAIGLPLTKPGYLPTCTPTNRQRPQGHIRHRLRVGWASCPAPSNAGRAGGTHILIGMTPGAEFYVDCCGPTMIVPSDGLGIVAFALDCPPGQTYTVTVWLTETGIAVDPEPDWYWWCFWAALWW